MTDLTRAPAFAIPVYVAPAPGAAQKNITTSTGTQVYTGAGYATGILVNTPESGATVALYDGTSTSGTPLGTYPLTAQGLINLGALTFVTGLFAETAGGSPANITIQYVPG